ncbi:MAG TPA: tRNA (adenosine(37)-N6)-threonylcarbamoyltransferase complex ATPase subunit type 1 TsaE [Spirochaetia bacterium]|nr:tRNA (adenosine(37)-N6)-threonylcarbamoyltransferase complex ATPase subunit type 1 TsaE [Spirochaetia bacterium]
MKTTIKTHTEEETISCGKDIGKRLFPGAVVALSGTLGAGKTTLVKGIAQALDIEEEVTSPSFTIISEYEGSLPLYHMDLYRIESIREFEDLGSDEMLGGKGICVIEWSEKVESVLPPHVRVHITVEDGTTRVIEIEGLDR